jgi:hypothetical protein
MVWGAPLWRVAAAGWLSVVATACDPTVVIGARVCAVAPGNSDAGGAIQTADAAVNLPWSTGFEDGFCDYAPPMGFCYGTGSYTLVTSPVHSGHYAAAFSVYSSLDAGAQVRCVEQGVFPRAAYYGAWYYVPTTAVNTELWNLLHFQGGPAPQTLDGGPPAPQHGLWDVSLVNVGDAGNLHVSLFDFLTGTTPDASAVPPIPIAAWFHIEVYFNRANDATGELSVFQDGTLAADIKGITDDTNWGQWYVGNLATSLVPPASTVYVDDVTIASAP